MNIEYRANILIDKSPEDVFEIIAALDRANEWMPTSGAYLGTDLTSDLPVRKGTTYNSRSPQGTRSGVVEIFDPPSHIVFKEILKKVFITIEYTLSSEGSRTRLDRHVVIEGPLMTMLLYKFYKKKFHEGNKRVLQGIKAELEKS